MEIVAPSKAAMPEATYCSPQKKPALPPARGVPPTRHDPATLTARQVAVAWTSGRGAPRSDGPREGRSARPHELDRVSLDSSRDTGMRLPASAK